MMINPFWKNGETHKLTYKKIVAKDFPAKTASYCIPSFTPELKIQTDLFFSAETWFFEIPPPAFNKRFFEMTHATGAGVFFFGKTPTLLSEFVGATYPRHPVYQFRLGFLSHPGWFPTERIWPGRTCSSAFGSGHLDPSEKRGTEGRQDMAERYICINI